MSSANESFVGATKPAKVKRAKSKKPAKLKVRGTTKRKYRRKRGASIDDFVVAPAPPKEKPLTDEEVRKILGEDSAAFGPNNNSWVRRSSRQPSKSQLNAPGVKDLIDKLKNNDSDMVVLKMKKYLNDSDVAPIVMDAALDALEENTNCQALYIQVRLLLSCAVVHLNSPPSL